MTLRFLSAATRWKTAWALVDPIRAAWRQGPLTNREFYSVGTWGPVAADDLLSKAGHVWHEPGGTS